MVVHALVLIKGWHILEQASAASSKILIKHMDLELSIIAAIDHYHSHPAHFEGP